MTTDRKIILDCNNTEIIIIILICVCVCVTTYTPVLARVEYKIRSTVLKGAGAQLLTQQFFI